MLIRVYHHLLAGLAVVAGAVLIFVVASITFEVVMRYFLNRPTSWVVDFSQYALVYITFLAAAWVLKREGHVKIEVLVDYLPQKTQRALNTTTSIIGALLCGLFFWYSLQITVEAFEAKAMFVEATVVLKWPILMVLPLGSFVIGLQFLRRAWLFARKNIPDKQI